MYQYRVVGTWQDGNQRSRFNTVINADSGEEAIRYAMMYHPDAEVTEVHYIGEAEIPKGRGRVK